MYWNRTKVFRWTWWHYYTGRICLVAGTASVWIGLMIGCEEGCMGYLQGAAVWTMCGVVVGQADWPSRRIFVFLFSSCEGHGCHSTIRGSGSPPAECSIVSCLLNRQRGEREVQPLLWHRCKTAAEMEKKKNIWWLYNYTVNTVPPPPAFFLLFFLFIPFLPPSPSFFLVECLLIKHFH